MSPIEACPAWQEAISAFLDGVLPTGEEQAVHAHLRACPACARYLVDLVPIVQTLRAWPQLEPESDPWPTIARLLARDPAFGASPWSRQVFVRLRRPATAWAAAAACVVVGLGSWGLHQHQAVATTPVADMDLYWQQHEMAAHGEALPTMYTPELKAIKASYQLSP